MKKCLSIKNPSAIGHAEQKKRSFTFCVWNCGVQVGPTYVERMAKKAAAVPKEKKQTLLDALRRGTVGEAIKEAGIENDVGHHIIAHELIGSVSYLKTTV